MFQTINVPTKSRYVRLRTVGRAFRSASGGTVIVLFGLLAVELCLASRRPDVRPPLQTYPLIVNAEIGDSRSPPDTAISAWRDEVLGRPLFASSRRPVPEPSQAPARAEISRLSGIIITPTEKVAVFSPSMGSPIIVAENGEVGSFAVLSITTDSVTVRGSGGLIVMHPGNSYQRLPEIAAPDETILPGGIAANLIKVPLSSFKPDWPVGLHPS